MTPNKLGLGWLVFEEAFSLASGDAASYADAVGMISMTLDGSALRLFASVLGAHLREIASSTATAAFVPGHAGDHQSHRS